MKKDIRSVPAILFFILASGFFSSCTPEEEFSGNARIEAAFRLKSNSAMDGKVTISEGFLKLDRIQARGTLRGEYITDITHPVPSEEPPYKLSMADSSQVTFALTSKAYEQLDLHLFLFQDNYELVINTTEDVPPPVAGNEDGEEQDEDNSDGDAGGGQDENENDNDDGEENSESDGEDENKDNDDDADQGEDDNSDGDHDDDDEEDSDDNEEDSDDDDEDKDDDEDGDHDDADDENDENEDRDDGDAGNHDKDKNKGKDKDKNKGKNDNDENDNDGDDDDDDDGRVSEALRTVDLDHFFQNAKPAMVVFGLYQNNGVIVNIIFAASGIEKFTLRAKQNDSFTISLDEQNTAEISFDPQRWFETLTPADIESASIQTYQQQKVLFIHKDFNTGLFQSLVSRIEASADLIISKGDAAGL